MTYWTVPADPRPTDDSERFEWEPNCYRVLGHRNFTAIWGSPLGEFDTKEAALEFIKTVKSLDQDDDGFIELTLHEQLTNIRTGQTSEDLIKSFEFNPETGVWE